MDVALGAHVAAGSVAPASGYVALYTAKDERLHRRAGLLFVGAMVAMAAVGMRMAVTRDHRAPAVNVPAGLTVTYHVLTALTTVRPSTTTTRRLDRAATVVALGVGLASLALGVETAVTGVRRDGIPAFPWRMRFALTIAALSFFLGQAKVIPKPIRIYPLLALPVLAVLVTMLWWLWRVRRGIGHSSGAHASPLLLRNAPAGGRAARHVRSPAARPAG